MKKPNSTCEFARHRSELLLQNFRASIATQSKISRTKALKEAVELPAPRFWVSEARAAAVVGQLLRGIDALSGMHDEKRKMYEEIFLRVRALKRLHPSRSIGDLVFEVVNNEAPRYYIKWETAGKLIKALRK